MPGPDWTVSVVLAYVGLGSGLEFIPYFAALLGLVAAALTAVVQRPLLVVTRWLMAKRKQEATVQATQPCLERGGAETSRNETA
jgi:hypothetical protein